MPIEFKGGPLDGQGTMTEEEMMDPAMAEMMGAPAPGGPPGGGPEEDPEQSESAMFSSLLETIRSLLSSGTLSEQNKLNLEKASTLVQQIAASEEKDEEAAMTGKLNPGIMRKMGSGGGY